MLCYIEGKDTGERKREREGERERERKCDRERERERENTIEREREKNEKRDYIYLFEQICARYSESSNLSI